MDQIDPRTADRIKKILREIIRTQPKDVIGFLNMRLRESDIASVPKKYSEKYNKLISEEIEIRNKLNQTLLGIRMKAGSDLPEGWENWKDWDEVLEYITNIPKQNYATKTSIQKQIVSSLMGVYIPIVNLEKELEGIEKSAETELLIAAKKQELKELRAGILDKVVEDLESIRYIGDISNTKRFNKAISVILDSLTESEGTPKIPPNFLAGFKKTLGDEANLLVVRDHLFFANELWIFKEEYEAKKQSASKTLKDIQKEIKEEKESIEWNEDYIKNMGSEDPLYEEMSGVLERARKKYKKLKDDKDEAEEETDLLEKNIFTAFLRFDLSHGRSILEKEVRSVYDNLAEKIQKLLMKHGYVFPEHANFLVKLTEEITTLQSKKAFYNKTFTELLSSLRDSNIAIVDKWVLHDILLEKDWDRFVKSMITDLAKICAIFMRYILIPREGYMLRTSFFLSDPMVSYILRDLYREDPIIQFGKEELLPMGVFSVQIDDKFQFYSTELKENPRITNRYNSFYTQLYQFLNGGKYQSESGISGGVTTEILATSPEDLETTSDIFIPDSIRETVAKTIMAMEVAHENQQIGFWFDRSYSEKKLEKKFKTEILPKNGFATPNLDIISQALIYVCIWLADWFNQPTITIYEVKAAAAILGTTNPADRAVMNEKLNSASDTIPEKDKPMATLYENLFKSYSYNIRNPDHSELSGYNLYREELSPQRCLHMLVIATEFLDEKIRAAPFMLDRILFLTAPV